MKKIIVIFTLVLLSSCTKKAESEKQIDAEIPVTITTIDTVGINSYVDLNATATFLVKNNIKANATGYLNSVTVQNNDYVSKGQTLFTLQTREAKVLGNTINKIDPSLKFGSPIKINAAANGYINSINAQAGDYVQDGDQLAVINDMNSFGIVLSLPYELREFVKPNQELNAFLPDGSTLKTIVQKFTPSVDAASQTQNVILKCSKTDIPENLIVKVRIYKKSKTKSISLPKSAVLSDETESEFWIMKMINGNTAVKVPITKGITTDNRIEVLSPHLNAKDRILLTGNYGVADTIKVKVIKNQKSE
jgi:multidrug efflux pump subunit AcrA (membrane-fusion protein)